MAQAPKTKQELQQELVAAKAAFKKTKAELDDIPKTADTLKKKCAELEKKIVELEKKIGSM